MEIYLTDRNQGFRIEFRYVTKLGKRAELHRGSVKAITTCVLIAGPPQFKTPLIAIDNALCTDADNFSRREGRNRAFRKLLDHCGALKTVREALWIAFHRAISGMEKCPSCGGRGWMRGEGHDGEACLDCMNSMVIGGTGWKYRWLPIFDNALLDPPLPAAPKKPKPTAEQKAIFVEAGAAKREARAQRRLDAVANVEELIGAKFKAVGALEGVLETLTVRGQTQFKIYDSLTGIRITCYIDRERLEEAKAALPHRVAVYGAIKYAKNGRPLSVVVEQIRRLRSRGELPQTKDLHGIDITGGIDSSEYIRGLRDEE